MHSGISLWFLFAFLWLANEVDHLFMCFLLFYFSFEKYLFISCPHFIFFGFIKKNYKTSLYNMGMSTLSDMHCRHFLPIRDLPFCFLNVIFWRAKVLTLVKVSVTFFTFMVLFLCVLFKNLWQQKFTKSFL